MRKPIVQKTLLLLLAVLGAFFLALSDGSAAAPSAPPMAGDRVLRIDMPTDIDYVDPALAYFTPTWQIEQATCAKLLNYPDLSGEQGRRLVPEIARGMPAVSEDGRSYTFQLRDDFFFAPPWNERVTPAHFKWALERALNPRMSSPSQPFFRDIVGARDVIEGRTTSLAGVVVEGSTLRITLEQPTGDFLARLTMPFACPMPLSVPVTTGGIAAPVPSAGPYYVDTWERGRRLHVSRNPNYRGDRPAHFDEMEFAIGLPLQTIRERVESGQSDFGDVPPAAHAELAALYGPGSPAAAAGRQRWFANPATTFRYLALNHDRPLFGSGGPRGNVNLKRAVNFAIDRAAMVAQRGAFAGETTDQYLPPLMSGFRDVSLYPDRPDVARARELAGWQPGNPMRPAVMYCSNTGAGPPTCEIVRQNLAEIGLDVEVKHFPRAVQFTRTAIRGEPFDLTLEGWAADYFDPYDFLFLLDGTTIRPTQNTNFSYFNDPEFNAKLHAANGLAGQPRLDALGALDAEIAAEAAPLAAFGNDNIRSFFSDRIGCQIHQAPNNSVDLAALCLRPEIAIGDVSVDESAGTASFPVTIASDEASPVDVAFATADESAHAGPDYEATAGTVTFEPGERTETITVPIVDDGVHEPDETFVVRLTSTSRGTVLDAEAVGRIVDDDPAMRNFRGELAGLREQVAALGPSLAGNQAQVRLRSVLEFLDSALERAYWDADGNLLPRAVFAARRVWMAILYLDRPNAELEAASADQQFGLAETLRAIAEHRYAEVAAHPGASPSALNNARSHLDLAAASPGSLQAAEQAIKALDNLKGQPPQ